MPAYRLNCSTHCVDDMGIWERWVHSAVEKAELMKVGQSWNRTETRKHWICPSLGVPCWHLGKAHRLVIAKTLKLMDYRGASAEVGVWLGAHSRVLLDNWRSGGTHLLVDPWKHDPCPQVRGAKDKQCQHSQDEFDKIATQTVKTLSGAFPSRVKVLRNYSVAAATMVPHASLDFVYLDARHDFEGIAEDMQAWWPKVCPGGIMAGHDLKHQGVEKAVSQFPSHHSGQVAATFFTAEGMTPSWIFFRRPSLCKRRS